MQHGKSILTLLEHLYDRLTLHDPPQPSDLIFVHAGRMDRKQYGLELYRAGLAPRLLLSVGRFEVSKMAALGFPAVDELVAQRDRTAPADRHFFCDMNASGIRVERVALSPWNTYGEVAALRRYLKAESPRSLIVVSTGVHLRRVAATFARVFRRTPLQTYYCPVPGTRLERNYVLRETVKLAAYRAIFRMPDGAVGRIMRLTNLLG